MDTLLMVYFVTLSLELVLSLVMLTLLWMVLAPRGSTPGNEVVIAERPASELPRTPEEALRRAFQTVSCGRNEQAVLVHARHMLLQVSEQER